MGRTAAQALIEKGKELGTLQTRREVLIELMQDKFGSIPQQIEHRIQAIEDINILRELTLSVPKVNSIGQLPYPLKG